MSGLQPYLSDDVEVTSPLNLLHKNRPQKGGSLHAVSVGITYCANIKIYLRLSFFLFQYCSTQHDKVKKKGQYYFPFAELSVQIYGSNECTAEMVKTTALFVFQRCESCVKQIVMVESIM